MLSTVHFRNVTDAIADLTNKGTLVHYGNQDYRPRMKAQPQENDGINIIIVKIEWGNPKKRCEGFGLCRTEWFPGWAEWWEKITTSSADYHYVPLQRDSISGKYYIDILLNEDVPSHFFQILSSGLTVEETELLPAENNLINLDLTIPSGTYFFDTSLGEHGGFGIYLR